MRPNALQPEPDIETIMPLTTDAVDGHNKACYAIFAGDINWRTNITLSDMYSCYQKEFEEVLKLFSDILDGHLGYINETIYRIRLKPNSKPIFQYPYCTGPKLRQL